MDCFLLHEINYFLTLICQKVHMMFFFTKKCTYDVKMHTIMTIVMYLGPLDYNVFRISSNTLDEIHPSCITKEISWNLLMKYDSKIV